MIIELSNGEVIVIPDNLRDEAEDRKREQKLKEQRSADHIEIHIREE